MKRKTFIIGIIIGLLTVFSVSTSAQSDRVYTFTFNVEAKVKNDFAKPEPFEPIGDPIKFILKDEKDQRKSILYGPCEYHDIEFDGGLIATFMQIGLQTIIEGENGLSLKKEYEYDTTTGVIGFTSCYDRYSIVIAKDPDGRVILAVIYAKAKKGSLGYYLTTSEPNEANQKEFTRMQQKAQSNIFHGFKKASSN